MADEPTSLAEMHATVQTTTPLESTETASSTETEVESTTESTETETETAADEGAELGIREFLTQELQFDASKYQTDEDALKGLAEAARTLGKRNEDAEYGKRLRQLTAGRTEEQIAALLQSNGEATKPKTETADESPEYDPAWRFQITQNTDGDWVPTKGAPSDVVQKLRKYTEWREKRLDELARAPGTYAEKALKDKQADIDRMVRETVAQELYRHQIVGQLQSWEGENREILYVNGKDESGGLTPIGREIVTLDRELLEEGIQDPIKRLNRAKKEAVDKHQAVSAKIKKLPAKLIRKPAIAPDKTAGSKTIDELFGVGKPETYEDGTLAKAWLAQQQHA